MNQAQIEEKNERAEVIFLGVAGATISLIGFGAGIFAHGMYFLAVPLGLIMIGLSEILKKLSNK